MIMNERSERAEIFAFLRLIQIILRDLKILMGQLDIFVRRILRFLFCNPYYMALIRRPDILEMFIKYYERAERASRFFHFFLNILFFEPSISYCMVNHIYYRHNNILVCCNTHNLNKSEE